MKSIYFVLDKNILPETTTIEWTIGNYFTSEASVYWTVFSPTTFCSYYMKRVDWLKIDTGSSDELQ